MMLTQTTSQHNKLGADLLHGWKTSQIAIHRHDFQPQPRRFPPGLLTRTVPPALISVGPPERIDAEDNGRRCSGTALTRPTAFPTVVLRMVGPPNTFGGGGGNPPPSTDNAAFGGTLRPMAGTTVPAFGAIPMARVVFSLAGGGSSPSSTEDRAPPLPRLGWGGGFGSSRKSNASAAC